MQGTEQQKKGYEKVKNFCKHAQLQHVWVDTCCIDKSSSAELSEAINSMFKWYRDAAVCFVYLNIETAGKVVSADELQASRWISRGWCLQELIAPSRVEFFNRHWRMCGDRRGLAKQLHQVTNIDSDVLGRVPGDRVHFDEFSIAKRMSWASNRITTRPEDTAYCLLGLFGVHMPLLYGEGGKRAFFRLQEEIMKQTMDYSLLARDNTKQFHYRGLLASSPDEFHNGARIVTFATNTHPYEMSKKGLHVTLPIIDVPGSNGDVHAVLHNCRYKDDFRGPIAIVLGRTQNSNDLSPVYFRKMRPLQVVDLELSSRTPMRSIYIASALPSMATFRGDGLFRIWLNLDPVLQTLPVALREGITLQAPSNGVWNPGTQVFELSAAWTNDSKPVHALLCYKTDKKERPLVKLVISRSNPLVIHSLHIGLCEPSLSVERHHVLPDKFLVTGLYGHSFQVTARGELKTIMGEDVFKVNFGFKFS